MKVDGHGVMSLQRGRAPESAEIHRYGVGNRRVLVASTGPRSGERGDAFSVLGVAQRLGLQRGRAPESAEMKTARLNEYALVLLQRGRAPESAEIVAATRDASSKLLLQRGRAPESAEMVRRYHTACPLR